MTAMKTWPSWLALLMPIMRVAKWPASGVNAHSNVDTHCPSQLSFEFSVKTASTRLFSRVSARSRMMECASMALAVGLSGSKSCVVMGSSESAEDARSKTQMGYQTNPQGLAKTQTS